MPSLLAPGSRAPLRISVNHFPEFSQEVAPRCPQGWAPLVASSPQPPSHSPFTLLVVSSQISCSHSNPRLRVSFCQGQAAARSTSRAPSLSPLSGDVTPSIPNWCSSSQALCRDFPCLFGSSRKNGSTSSISRGRSLTTGKPDRLQVHVACFW